MTVEAKRGKGAIMPPCWAACPAGAKPHGYIALIAQGKFEQALSLFRKDNPLAGICGRVCPHPCERECERGKVDQPIAIAALKRFMADYELQHNPKRPAPLPTTRTEKVAVVGSGPAGLIAAYHLRKMGYGVTLFESLPVLGGMLSVGIPRNRLPQEIINYETGYIQALGVEMKTGVTVGKEISLEELQKEYQAIFFATGAHKGLKLGIEGEDGFEGFLDCITLLRRVNLGDPTKPGEKVCVIGGGNAAIDAARTALRLGCSDVNIVYRRSRKEMPANSWEVEEAEFEGVKIHYLAAPVRILGANGKVTGMECIRMDLGEPDSSGRRRPVPVKGSEFVVECDVIVPAISQEPELSFLPENHGLEISKWNSFVIGEGTFMTNQPGIFAGGDSVTGPATVIEAVTAGHKAALMIDKYLRGEVLVKPDSNGKRIARFSQEQINEIEKSAHQEMAKLPLAERQGNFQEVELGFSEEQAISEAKRCLECRVKGKVIQEK
ncbi:MAG: FAD-dependent oxidoreductase [Candidatus Tectomicrobia bacterium]|uniref:FAD-dependent oxidoreductase n=1 Tax=Tectimicrobiota bacterium TaxID=2528274 RepID=A0A932CM64_UNCTE|nr:FAD-dependent oxidoreductase [Candidatus Tectomicrobia bacterium]